MIRETKMDHENASALSGTRSNVNHMLRGMGHVEPDEAGNYNNGQMM